MDPSPAAPAASVARGAWVLVALMWVAFFLNYTDRQVVYSIFPVLKSELHLSDTQLGLSSSLFLWVYAACSSLAGELGDRISKRRLITLSLVLWSVVTALTGLASSTFTLLGCRALMGISESVFYPAAATLTAEAHGTAGRSRAIAILGTAQLAGIVMGGWFGGFMADHQLWRMAFYSLGLFGGLYAIPYSLFLRRIPDPAPAVERRWAVPALMGVPTYRVLCVVFPSFLFVLGLIYTWLPNFFFEKFSLSLSEAGLMSTAYVQGATAAGLLLGGVLADRLYHGIKTARYWLVALGLLISAPAVQLLGNSDSLFLTKCAAAAFGFGSGLAIANFFACSFDVIPFGMRSAAVGYLNMLGGLLSGIAALLGGMLKESLGIHTLMSAAAGLCLAMSGLLILGTRLYFQRDFERAQGAKGFA